MTVAIVGFAVLSALFVLFLLIDVRIEVCFDYDEVEKKSNVLLKYGFIKYTIYPKKNPKKTAKAQKKSGTEEEKEEQFSFENKKREIEKYIRIFDAIKGEITKLLSYLARRAVVFDKIEVKSDFGFEDAMDTGIFTGIYNGFIYSVIGVIHHTSTIRDMDIKLQPIFGKKCFYNRFSCILHIKTVHIIIIAFSVLKILRKVKKEGR